MCPRATIAARVVTGARTDTAAPRPSPHPSAIMRRQPSPPAQHGEARSSPHGRRSKISSWADRAIRPGPPASPSGGSRYHRQSLGRRAWRRLGSRRTRRQQTPGRLRRGRPPTAGATWTRRCVCSARAEWCVNESTQPVGGRVSATRGCRAGTEADEGESHNEGWHDSARGERAMMAMATVTPRCPPRRGRRPRRDGSIRPRSLVSAGLRA